MNVADQYRAEPGKKVRLKKWDSSDKGPFKDKHEAREHMDKRLGQLSALQERLYAEGKQSLLLVLQGMDTSGKDGTIRHVMSGANPQSCLVTSFKAPTTHEKAHDYLWRIHQQVPPRGSIGIFNRSHYEDVLITRVHDWIDKDEAKRRLRQIADFERMLVENGTRIVKAFLHISKDEQRERLQSRLDDSEKRWKFNPEDIAERKYWADYQDAYEDAIAATSTDDAPWYVVPANHKWFRNLVVADIVVHTLQKMDPKFPKAAPGVRPGKFHIR